MKLKAFIEQLRHIEAFYRKSGAVEDERMVASLCAFFNPFEKQSWVQFKPLLKRALTQVELQTVAHAAHQSETYFAALQTLTAIHELLLNMKAPKTFRTDLKALIAVFDKDGLGQEKGAFGWQPYLATLGRITLHLFDERQQEKEAEKQAQRKAKAAQKRAEKAKVNAGLRDKFVYELKTALDHYETYKLVLENLSANKPLTVADVRLIAQEIVGGDQSKATKKKCLDLIDRYFSRHAIRKSRDHIIANRAV